jgi:large subunit ribosomal protein L25
MAKLERVTTLTFHRREHVGTTGARASRRAGRVPGVLYGHGGGSVPIEVEARALGQLLATGGRSHILDATFDGAHDSVLLREVQRDPISLRPLSADFQRVSLSEEIHAEVPIVTTGVPIGVKEHGGVMDVVSHVLELKGPAGKLPEQLEVDVSGLDIHDHITAGDVLLPPGFTLITPRETLVVGIEVLRAAETEVPAATAPAAEAPEAAPTPAE